MAFLSQESWSGLPFPSPGDLPDPGIKPWSPALLADSLPPEPPGKYSYTTDTDISYISISRRYNTGFKYYLS